MFSSRVSTGTVSLKRPDLGGVDLGDAFDRPRPLEVRAGLQHAGELAEAQHDAALLFGHQHEAVEDEPQDEQDGDPAADAAAVAPRRGRAGVRGSGRNRRRHRAVAARGCGRPCSTDRRGYSRPCRSCGPRGNSPAGGRRDRARTNRPILSWSSPNRRGDSKTGRLQNQQGLRWGRRALKQERP